MECILCHELVKSRTQIVYHDSVIQNKMLVIGEAPGEVEDRTGIGFSGKSGETLHSLLKNLGLVRGKDYACANVVRCRPPNNRAPKSIELWDCTPHLEKTIIHSKPRVILCVGLSAAKLFFQEQRLFDIINNPIVRVDATLQKAELEIMTAQVIAIPHTSPLAWNRYAPNGKSWASIGRSQLNLLPDILKEVV